MNHNMTGRKQMSILDWFKTRSRKPMPAPDKPAVSRPTDRDILAAFDAWTLACAVGSENGTIGLSYGGLDTWLRLSKPNWMPKVQGACPLASVQEIEATLRRFVQTNKAKNYQMVLREQESARGLRPSCVLGPGESMTLTVPLGAGKQSFSSAEIESMRHRP